MKFTVDRTMWGRGEGGGELRNPESGCQCCIGFVCRQLTKCKTSTINGVGEVCNLYKKIVDKFEENNLPASMLKKAYNINDDMHISDKVREGRLKKLFIKQNHEIEFV